MSKSENISNVGEVHSDEVSTTSGNVYTKIQMAKKILKDADIKKSGQVSFSGTKFNYYELSDFLPMVIDIFDSLGLFSHITFSKDMATLTIINADNPDEKHVEYTSPIPVDTTGINKNPIQAWGSVMTYQRRYLYMVALDIVEQDLIDGTTGATQGQGTQSNGAPPIARDYNCVKCGTTITSEKSIEYYRNNPTKPVVCYPCNQQLIAERNAAQATPAVVEVIDTGTMEDPSLPF